MNEHIDPVTGRRYRYKNGQGKQFDITMGAQDPDGKWRYTTSDGMEGYWDPSEVGSLEPISEAEPPSAGAQTSTDEPHGTGATEQEKGSESEPQSTGVPDVEPPSAGDALQNYDGLFDWPDDEEMSPVGTTVADSDWLAGLTPDAKKRERSLKAQKAIDALNMVSQAVQVLGRMPNSRLGAGGAQPMASDAYRKYMDRVYEQGQRYDNSIAAREKVLNAGKKLQMDYAVKKQKMILENRKYQLQLRRQEALNRKDEAQARHYEEQIKECQARIDALDKKTNAQIVHYQTLDSVAQQNADTLAGVRKTQEGVNKAREEKLRNSKPDSTPDDNDTEDDEFMEFRRF